MADQQFCLRWNNHQSTLISVFDSLLENGTLVDCTLAAEGKYLKAHKVVLSACSPYLETLLSQHYEKHPIVILKDVKFTELKSMMDYMYRGEVNISQDQLGTFLKAAESLQIKGLSDNGSDGDGRDVGSTSKGPPPRKTQPAPSTRPAESEPASPAHRSRDGSVSPSSRKRRRTRRNSQGDDANMGDSHLDSNSCDLPSQAQSTPIVPNIPAAVTSSITTTPIKTIIKPEQTELVNRIDTSNLNSLPPESGLLKEKIEPMSEPLLEPKTEYLDDANNDDSVEDLTLDDDDEMDEMDMSNMSNMSNISRPGPSHGNDVSNQGFVPWQIGNQSGTDEVFMAAQEAVQAHRGDSQGCHRLKELYENEAGGLENHDYMLSSDSELHPLLYLCTVCSEQFGSQALFLSHSCVEHAGAQYLDENEGAKVILPDTPGKKEFSSVELEEELSVSYNDAICQTDFPKNANTGKNLKPNQKRRYKNHNLMCSKCGKFFKFNYYLIHHACGIQPSANPLPRGALGKPPFKCVCGIVFKHKSSFCRHFHHECKLRMEVEVGSNEKLKFIQTLEGPPYKCNKCGAVMKLKHSLQRHLQGCGTPKQQPCPFCSHKFNTYSGMRTHLRLFHGVCSLCKREFKTKSECEEHQNNEHLICPFCTELFSCKEELDHHVHNEHLNI